MRFKFDGISIDLPYARLKVISIPADVDVFNPFFLKNIDDTSWKSLSGVHANRRILQLVPNVDIPGSFALCKTTGKETRSLWEFTWIFRRSSSSNPFSIHLSKASNGQLEHAAFYFLQDICLLALADSSSFTRWSFLAIYSHG